MSSDDQDIPDSKRFGAGGLIVAFVYVLAPGLAYYGAAQWIGIWGAIDMGGLVGGMTATYTMFAITMVMGESLIEDLVKFVVFSVACWASWSLFGPLVQAILMGVPVGAALPLMMRLVSPLGSAK